MLTLFTAAADLERNETTQLVEEAEVSGGGHASQRPPVPQAPSPGGSGESEPIPPPRAPGPRLEPGADTPRSPNPAKDVGEVGRGDAGGIHRVQNGPVTSPPSAPARSSVITAAGGGIRVQQQSRTANVTLQ